MKRKLLILVASVMFTSQAGAVDYPSVCNDSSLSIAVKPSATTADFTVVATNEALIVDNRTSLMWMRCELGQSLHPLDGVCFGGGDAMDWSSALQEAINVNADPAKNHGYTDWRLPNAKELMSIVEHQCINPSINSEIFPGALSGYVWTNTPADTAPITIRVANFSSGLLITIEDTAATPYVRLVRTYTP